MFSKNISNVMFQYGENGLIIEIVNNEDFAMKRKLQISAETAALPISKDIIRPFIKENLRNGDPVKSFLLSEYPEDDDPESDWR